MPNKKKYTRFDALDGFVGGHPFRFAVQHLGHLRRVREIRSRAVLPGIPDFRWAPGGGGGYATES